ncbi:uncharacterized protein LOC110247369 isoform X2 [Exaiptasia diaphana]|uniref:Uncharacterized protein n=1 Tax=Exaiptasia diaphana TaxID=2652724 RepID=A0A913XSB4_EXADI|nr:uncharacterized protein LOC110247369 isoform X2 [Exaiptasia diaphana]
MFSKKSINMCMAHLFDEDFLDEVEFLAIYDCINKKNPCIPYSDYRRFDLDSMTEDECKTEFRFGKAEIGLLAEAMGIPDNFTCSNGTKASGIEGLCVVLKRYSYPCRYVDMVPRFGRSIPELCEIASEVSDFIYNNHGYLLNTLNQPWLSPDHLQSFADAIHDRKVSVMMVVYLECQGFFIKWINMQYHLP